MLKQNSLGKDTDKSICYGEFTFAQQLILISELSEVARVPHATLGNCEENNIIAV